MGVRPSSALWSPSLQARKSMLISFVSSWSGIAADRVRSGRLYLHLAPPNISVIDASTCERILRLSGVEEHMKPILASMIAGAALLTTVAEAQLQQSIVVGRGTRIFDRRGLAPPNAA